MIRHQTMMGVSLLLFRSLLALTVVLTTTKSSRCCVDAFSVLTTRPQISLLTSTISSEVTVSDETYQTNLEIARLASESPRNATASLAAHALLEKLPNPDTVTFNGVLKAHAKSPSLQGALKAQDLLEQMEALHEEQSKLNRERNLQISSDDQHECENGAARISVKPDVRSYSTVMDAWSRRSGKFPDAALRAQDILERLEGIYNSTRDSSYLPNTITYNTVIAAWAKDGISDKALLLLRKMGPLADVISYNTVLLAIARSGLPNAGERAEQLLRKMTVRPNSRTYTTVIDAWSRSQNVARALALLQEMEDLYETTGDVSIRPNCISYSTVINAYALSREPNKATMAWKLLQRMKELSDSGSNVHAKPSLITLNSVLNACATSSTIEHARVAKMVHMLYREIQQDPSLQPDHFTYGTVLKACANVFCADEDTPEFVKQVFYQCCEDGQVSFGVCYQLRQAATSEVYRSLIPAKAYNPANGHFSIGEMPYNWTRNVRERRARECIDRSKTDNSST